MERMYYVESRVHKRGEKRVSNCLKLFLKYKGHQTYICIAVVTTPCQAAVLNI